MMWCAETIGPKSNMDHGFEPQELSDRFRQPQPALSAGQVSFVVGL